MGETPQDYFAQFGNIEVTNKSPYVFALAQCKSDDTTIIPEGGITNEKKVIFKATVSDADNDQVKLQFELRKITETFTGIPTHEIPQLASGTSVSFSMTDLTAGGYKWRCRAIDARGLASDWEEYGAPGNTDFVVNEAPTLTAVNQFKSDGITIISEGGTTNEKKVIFKATMTDPDGDQGKLQIELRKTNEPFTGTQLRESSLVNSGTTVTIIRDSLDAGSYKWRCRTKDAKGLVSAWKVFGTPGNTDFTVTGTPGISIIYPDAASSQLVSEEFWVNVHVGTSANPVTKLFGLGFVLNFTPTNYIDVVMPYTSSITPAAFIGESGAVVLHQTVDENAGKINVGISRKNGQSNVKGYGAVLRVKFVSRSNTPSGTQVKFFISNVTAVDSLGNAISLNSGSKNIVINPSPTRTVWPGDTNNDLVVNQADVLPLGLYWGNTGSIRPNASMSWIAQSCTSWPTALATYADAAGDGKIEQNDVLPIGINWGKTHAAPAVTNIELTKTQTSSSATISPKVIPVEQAPNHEFAIRVKVNEVNNLFGLSFELVYDQPQLLQNLSVAPDSLFGSDLVFYSNVDAAKGKIAVGISRKVPQSGMNGAGAIVYIKAKIAANASAGTKINFTLQNVAANDAQGAAMPLSPQSSTLTIGSVTADEFAGENSLPLSHRLHPNHPNPFKASTLIRYEIPQAGQVLLQIYNLAGQEILQLVNEVQQPGRYQINWNGRDQRHQILPSGIYICRLQAGSFAQTQRMIVVR